MTVSFVPTRDFTKQALYYSHSFSGNEKCRLFRKKTQKICFQYSGVFYFKCCNGSTDLIRKPLLVSCFQKHVALIIFLAMQGVPSTWSKNFAIQSNSFRPREDDLTQLRLTKNVCLCYWWSKFCNKILFSKISDQWKDGL